MIKYKMDYQNDLTSDSRWRKKDALKNLNSFEVDVVIVDDVPRWKINNQIPFDEMLSLWHINGKEFDYEKAVAQRKEDSSNFLQNYRKAMENHVPDDEELFEMECAFGKGTTVVNVITGKSITL